MFSVQPDRSARRRWLLCLALALLIHIAAAAGVVALTDTSPFTDDKNESSQHAIQVSMVAAADTPAPSSTLIPAPVPISKPTSTPAPIPSPSLKPSSKPDKKMAASVAPPQPVIRTEEPSVAEQAPPERSERDGKALLNAQQQTPTSPSSEHADEKARWHERVRGYLASHKRYPRRAHARRQQGVVAMRVVVDRRGNVLHRQVNRSSGYVTLDRAALELIGSASPLPPPPAQVDERALTFDIPIDYMLK